MCVFAFMYTLLDDIIWTSLDLNFLFHFILEWFKDDMEYLFKRTTRHISRKSVFLHKFFINTVNFIWSFTKFDTYLNWSMHNMKIFHVIQIQSFFMEETCNNTCVFMFITAINCYNSRALHVLFPPYLF